MRDTNVQAWQEEPPLTLSAARQYLEDCCFVSSKGRKIGLELEWLVYDPADLAAHVSLPRLEAIELSEPLAAGGWVGIEPGGQVELASSPAPDITSCLLATNIDLDTFRQVFAQAGLRLVGMGLDPLRLGKLLNNRPRYIAMNQAHGPHDPTLGHVGCSTASIQVNIDCGDDSDSWQGYRARWRLLHLLGPVLTAAFGNSPYRPPGIVSNAKSLRQLVRFQHFPERSMPLPLTDDDASWDPQQRWQTFALDAQVLFIRTVDPPWLVLDRPFSFRDWLDGAGPRLPTVDDLRYHLSTLMPPIKPRGYFELRMLDALDNDDWMVPPAVITGLLDDELAHEQAYAALRPLYADATLLDVWLAACEHGLAHPDIAQAAKTCFEAALDGLDRLGIPLPIRHVISDFVQRYPAQARCPADDLLAIPPRALVIGDGQFPHAIAA